MDKNTYETYEYLPTNSESVTDQFFVVQDDGTFLINRQVQYVAQVQDVKEALDTAQPCTVYDVTSQQFFVDVDNSTDMISVPDNYILPVPAAEESSNLYNNSYLLQAVPDSTTDQIEVEDDQYNKEAETNEDIDVVNILNKPTAGCTEITITDEQYKMLEEKGWILLETNDKVFVLNTLGLHDITANHDLIEQYRAANQTSATIQEEQLTAIKLENLSTIKLENIASQNPINQQDAVELVVDNTALNDKENITELPLEFNNGQSMLESNEQDLEKNVLDVEKKPELNDIENAAIPTIVTPSVQMQRNNILRIKTKYCFKDIPDKIVLGKTVNGKNLVARVVKRSCNTRIRNNIPPDSSSASNATVNSQNKEMKSHSSRLEFQLQVNQALTKNSQKAEHFAAANEVVMQLLQIPAFQPSLTGRNVIVTRAKSGKDARNRTVHHSNTITGSVEPIEGEDGEWQLVHKPNLLRQLHAELDQYMKDGNASKDKTKTLEDFSVLHVHVAEKNESGLDSVSITLNKRQIPYNPNAYTTSERKKPTKLFACSSCASIFRYSRELLDHQEIHSMEDKLTIDTDKIDLMGEKTNMKPYYVIKTKKGTQYACLQCPMQFNKITNCQRHVKTHQPLENSKDGTEPKSKEATEQIYQCSLCSSSYHHASSLTKHFTSVHVKAQVKRESTGQLKSRLEYAE